MLLVFIEFVMKNILFFLCLAFHAHAQLQSELDPVIISSKQAVKVSELTSSAVVIETDEIEAGGQSRAVDILNRVSGVDVVQTGLVGGQSSVFLRGMESRHVLILIDGVRVYDPASSDRSFNLAILNTLDIEKIEVIKGAQSVLYGTDAMAGVINIITKKRSDQNTLRLATGYYEQIAGQQSFDTSYGAFYMNGYWQHSEVDSVVQDGAEKDRNNTKGFTLGHFGEFERLEFDTTFKYTDNFSDTDAQILGDPIDSNGAYAKDFHTFFREEITYHHNQRVDVFLDLSYGDYQRTNKYLQLFPNDFETDETRGRVLTGELRVKEETEGADWLYGMSTIQEKYQKDQESEQAMRSLDGFVTRSHKDKKHIYDVGARFTNNSDYGSHLVYSLGYNYLISTKEIFKLGHKSGFKAPSNYQINDPLYGNDELGPEKSVGWDAEYAYKTPNLRMHVAGFYNQVSHFIQFENGAFTNEDQARYQGVEAGFELVESIGLVAGSLNTTSYELSSGKKAARRPNLLAKLKYQFYFDQQGSLSIDWQYRGKSYDYVGSEQKTLAGFDLWDLNYTFEADNYRLVASMKNIFDRDYETIYGYSTLGASFQINAIIQY